MHEPLLPPGNQEAGCDEAGRGCLAGPVFAAAVILPEGMLIPGLNDSKKLTEKRRYALRSVIESEAITYGVALATPTEIDEINILNASYLAMHRALDKLQHIPREILVDGNRFKPFKNIEYRCIIKGDSRHLSIAAASVLAKTYRDDYMRALHPEFPEYQWDQNKGYPTKKHRLAITENGTTPHHRKSFRLTTVQLELNF